MYILDFNKNTNIFFCGIGGISMSGLADVLIDKGLTVSGSDRSASELTESLSNRGAHIYIGQGASNITDDIDVFVYTAAIHQDHPEFVAALSKNIPMLTRAELLGQIMKNYEFPVAVSGTHGKTTVTSMLSEIFMEANLDPTISVGGILESIGGNIRVGHSDLFITEACEYTNSFHSFFPKASIILNVEEDHLDFFKDIDEIRASFNTFAKLTPQDGVLIVGNDIPEKDVVVNNVASTVITFGKTNEADYYPEDVSYDNDGNCHFNVCSKLPKEAFSLKVPGFHNVLNALAAIALADYMNIDRNIIKKALSNFGGAKRRFEYKGEYNGITIVDDYAHHPSEIAATLTAAKNYPHKKLWTVFQPHTYTRTKAFLDEFADALSLSDAVILADIYAARETDNLGISSADIKNRINNLGTESYHLSNFEEIKEFIKNNCAPGDLLITMGAGDIVNIANDLTAK